MSRLFAHAAFAAAFGGLVLASMISPADAGGRGYAQNGNRIGYVIARSEFGNGSVRGAVRRARYGRQVQLPGGSWVYCDGSCKHTLRLKTVDFWHSDQGAGPQNSTTHGGGIFGDLSIRLGW